MGERRNVIREMTDPVTPGLQSILARPFAAPIGARSARPGRRHWLTVVALSALSLGPTWIPTRADPPSASPSDRLESIVVIGKKRAISDSEVTRIVETAMRENPLLLDDHITVETINGVVWLRGLAFDQWSLERAYRAARKASGGKRIVLDLELVSTSEI